MNAEPTTLYLAAGVLAVAGLAFIVLVTGGRRPKGAVEWAAVTVSGLLVTAAVGLAFVTYSVERGADLGPDRKVVGRAAPSLAFNRVADDGGERLEDYRGQVVLLNLWATWCAPCMEELPALNRLQQRYNDQGLVVLSISDEPRETLARFARERPMRAVNAYLPDSLSWPSPYSRVEASRPTAFVVDREGTIRATWPGTRTYPELERAVQPYL